MELNQVINKRKMIRSFKNQIVPQESIDSIVNSIFKGPSAGFSQGTEILVLRDSDDKELFYCQWGNHTKRTSYRNKWPGIENADTIIIFCASKLAYEERYSAPDKGGNTSEKQNWRVPWWYVDTGMSMILSLLSLVDNGLGGCIIRIKDPKYINEEFGIPEDYDPMAAILIGTPEDRQRKSKSVNRGRRPVSETTHYGKW